MRAGQQEATAAPARDLAPVLAVVVATALAAVLLIFTATDRSRAELDRRAGREAVAVADRLQRILDDGLAAVLDAQARPGERSIGTVRSLTPADAAETLPPGLVAVARDEPGPAISLVGESALVVDVLYESAGALSVTPPVATTAVRRSSVARVLLWQADVSEALTTADPGATATVVPGRLATPGRGSRFSPRGTGTATVVEGASAWTVVVSRPGPALRGADWIGLVAIGLTGMAAVAAERRSRRRTAALAEELRRERDRAAVISDLAPVLQSSLHLETVLPSLAVQLTDRFDLAGVRVAVADEQGSLVDVFTQGLAPNAEGAGADLPAELSADGSASLALTRGGRLVAELRFRAGRPLTRRDLEAVEASAELVTSAIVTAQAVERQLRAVDQLNELDALKTVFLSTAAHELRTPVAAISGLSDMLSRLWDSLPDDERRMMAGRIAANGVSLGALVQDLLDFSHLETGELTTASTPLDLAESVKMVVDRLQVVWPDHDVVVSHEDGPAVLGDPLAVERIVTNLVSNAAKYSPAGTQIDVRVEVDGDHTCLTIDDQGSGIAPQDREKVFGRFYRGDGPEVLATRGVGIGLSVVKEFVRQMDGTVTVAESPSGGARFVCRFPHAPVSALPQEAS